MVYRQKHPSPKKLAIAAGQRHYFTGKPCKNGHIAERWTHNSVCSQCGAESTEHWRKRNMRRVADSAKRWRAANPEKEKANKKRSNAKWYAKPENKEKVRLLAKIRYEQHGDEIRRRARERARTRDKRKKSAYQKEWYAKNKDYARTQAKKWAAAHPDKARAGKRNAKAKRKNADGKHTAADVAAILKMQKRKCAYCKVKLGKQYHVDHILPVVRGGTNGRANLQITCAACNLSKAARHPIEFSRQLGMLL